MRQIILDSPRSYDEMLEELHVIHGEDYIMRQVFISMYQWFRSFPLIIQFIIDRDGACYETQEDREKFLFAKKQILDFCAIDTPNDRLLKLMENKQ